MKMISFVILSCSFLGLLSIRAESPDAIICRDPSAAGSIRNQNLKSTPVTNLSLSSTEEAEVLTLLNEGSEEELASIRGIALTRAEAIVNARPYYSVYEVILVSGVGDVTFERIIEHGKNRSQSIVKAEES